MYHVNSATNDFVVWYSSIFCEVVLPIQMRCLDYVIEILRYISAYVSIF